MKKQAIKLVSTLNMDREEWLKARNKVIGGSDIGVILGVNSYKSALKLYMEKIGEWQADDLSDNEAVYWGSVLEPAIADRFAKEHPTMTIKKCNFILQDSEHPFMLANIDREIYCAEKGKGVLEIKTTSAFNDKSWADSIPFSYMLQLQFYLHVTGYEYGYFATLIGGQKYIEYYIEKDQELIDIICEKTIDFWTNHVKALVAPLPSYEIDGGSILEKLYPVSNGTSIDLDEGFGYILHKIKDGKEEIKYIQDMIDKYECMIKEEMQENESARHDLASITWKTPKTSYTIKPALLKEKYPQIYDELKTEKASTRRFMIKFREV
jgi:putative phage-type endonuclease